MGYSGNAKFVRDYEEFLFGYGFVAVDAAVTDVNDAMSVHGNVEFMSNQDNGVALLVELLEQSHDFNAGSRIESAGGLIGQQDSGPVYKRSSDGDTLPLAARKLVRFMEHPLLQIDGAKRVARPLLALGRWNAGINQRQLDVMERGCSRQ